MYTSDLYICKLNDKYCKFLKGSYLTLPNSLQNFDSLPYVSQEQCILVVTARILPDLS